ncbi:hypothetical protein pipiens_008972 [Culex pipiens pipiens]|uniref:ZAD domain-containing protein n=1 Tax=Culex pipiens pipiens TaxID=38569 RepID=A0ABD1DFH1_CULPP
MSGLTDVDSPFVKTEKACKICGCSDGNMESMFCDADDSRMLNKIYKCTRVEVTPICGLISPICESCRKRIEAYDENAKPKVVEFVIKNEIEDALDYDPFSFQDPMASADPMASTDPMAENFDDINEDSDFEWQGREDFGDNDDDDDVKFDDSPNVKSSSEDDIPLKKRKISKVKVKTQKKYKRSAEGNSKLSSTGKDPEVVHARNDPLDSKIVGNRLRKSARFVAVL